jgi:hypothetical protein
MLIDSKTDLQKLFRTPKSLTVYGSPTKARDED